MNKVRSPLAFACTMLLGASSVSAAQQPAATTAKPGEAVVILAIGADAWHWTAQDLADDTIAVAVNVTET